MMAAQIYEYLCKPPQRPGYKMMNVAQDKLLSKDSEQDIIDLVNIYADTMCFSRSGEIVYCIQGPSDNSQLITHIHGFILQEGVIPDELKKSLHLRTNHSTGKEPNDGNGAGAGRGVRR